MSNPLHSPRVEATSIILEAIRRAHRDIDSFISNGVTPAYRRQTLDMLAKKYNSLLDKSGFDGMHIPKQDDARGHGH